MVDNYDMWENHEVEMENAYEKWHDSLPLCAKCGKKIEDEMCYKIDDELYHEDCIEKFKVRTENHYTRE